MMIYHNRILNLSWPVFIYGMALNPADAEHSDRNYDVLKGMLKPLMEPNDDYDDMIWLLCERTEY